MKGETIIKISIITPLSPSPLITFSFLRNLHPPLSCQTLRCSSLPAYNSTLVSPPQASLTSPAPAKPSTLPPPPHTRLPLLTTNNSLTFQQYSSYSSTTLPSFIPTTYQLPPQTSYLPVIPLLPSGSLNSPDGALTPKLL